MGAEKAQIAIAWAEHEGPCVARKNRYDIIHCEMCGFRHAVPLPKPADLEREYREAYYGDEKPTYLTHAGEDQQWKAAEAKIVGDTVMVSSPEVARPGGPRDREG